MAHWIDQTLHVSDKAEIILMGDQVVIQIAENQGWDGYATFHPVDYEDAATMSIALRLAAKRIEEIGKRLGE
jgi:hypothetical protein